MTWSVCCENLAIKAHDATLQVSTWTLSFTEEKECMGDGGDFLKTRFLPPLWETKI